ncbi:diaminopimelate epimerase [Aliikangiella marina]|uniref:Diaminopimelate epimerase n=1 Tax=Aliikangiella marina TaxID=1712262 RepID=A0A545T499_9GAMM|nr:diaminopimelate epimerase [Aliikangiella marina]TQV72054.1 diaminopimelate epimerase [Aliikangiella marina]
MISFAKMHGLGNDFMVVDGVSQQVYFTEGQVRKLADRHRGVGFDQLLLIEPPQQPDVDFHYRIFNADGKEVEQCGNGARCLARFVRTMGLTWKHKIRVSTMRGLMNLQIMRNGLVSVDMGVPQLAPDTIPMRYAQQDIRYSVNLDGVSYEFGAVSMGNPHCVITVDDVEKAEVDRIGGALTQHNLFPEGANIGFMQKIAHDEVRLRVFERGVGETQACGTGACAAAVVARLQHNMNQKIRVYLPGGHLHIDWPGDGESLKMMGPAELVYQGYIDL